MVELATFLAVSHFSDGEKFINLVYKCLELSQGHIVCGRVKNLIMTGFGILGGRTQKVEKEGGNSFATARKDI